MGDIAIKIEPEEDDHNAEKQHPNQPPKIVTKLRGDKKLEYIFVESVKSVDELHKLRFKNYCIIDHREVLPTFKSLIMRCSRKRTCRSGKKCDFELMALREKPESDTIHVYAHSDHNHPFMPEEKRSRLRNAAKQLMHDDDYDDENPPIIIRTFDNIKFTLVQTFSDYDQLQAFRRKSQCTIYLGRKSQKQVRLSCKHSKNFKCQFQLLSVKSTKTKQDYHVYTFGAHNHPVIKPKKKQQNAARGRQQKQQEMEVDEEEDDEDGQEEGEGQAEDEPIKGGGGEDNGNDIIVIDDGEEDTIKVKPKQEVKQEASMEIIATPLGMPNPTEETLEETLQKAHVKGYYEWMARFEPNQIEPKVVGMDTASLLKMVEMADQEVRQHPATFDKWRPWLKHAMPKCMSDVEDFDINSKYKHLAGIMFRHVKD